MAWLRRGVGAEDSGSRTGPGDAGARDRRCTGPESPSAGPEPPSGGSPFSPDHGSPPVVRPVAERAAHRLYVQIAWTTLDDLPLVAPDAREAAEARLIALCRRLDAEPVAIRASATGVALLLRVTPSHAVGALATALKAGSEDALAASGRPVRWARGFAAASVAPTEVRRRARRLRDAPRFGAAETGAFRETNDLSRSVSRAPTFPPSVRG